ncbi:50S ribosomal protein L18 [Mycoplasmopsis agassizii]|uniref:Large ribosomal subunit protein uL18 n=1 Tax=Mycoplasmopsis agassizii TaxID=33922 RepID=A0A1W1X2X2_9BACT|nr:50S ribosomal protein L18 [Mycoplasmopsis agassizii]PAF55391.1 50S ribosomal protein L18 [Mycoplasmopsis agassizii]PAK21672.1 50S ribosomal protein L18 [Mycoplasmopsis agassizii]SMC18254.1 large subunit ribosomal protein L18 [Mycoplasmopsis agassizii]
MANLSRNEQRLKKHLKIRSHIKGTAERPRVSVFRSHRNFSVQIIDDTKGLTLVSLSTAKKGDTTYHGNISAATELAKNIAPLMKKANIDKVVFDRSGYLYHGRVKAFAEQLRAEGISF